MKVYITKRALTEGIQVVEAILTTSETMIAVKIEPRGLVAYYHKPDWHVSWSEAVSRAEKMRLRKIASLRKLLAKLESLAFVGSHEPEPE